MIKADYQLADIFMLRAPVLPINVLNELATDGAVDATLKSYYSQKEVQEALFVASPLVYRMLNKWMNKPGDNTGDDEKIRFTLIKYLLRMSSRCTPFGTMAGIALGSFGSRTEISLEINANELFIRPDMQYLCMMSAELLRDHTFREGLRFYPNTSLYRHAETYRYVEYFTDKEGIRKYQLQSTASNTELDKILQASTHGAMLAELVKSIVNESVDAEAASEYIHILIDNQVLVSELEPRVTGKAYMEILMDHLRDNSKARNQVSILSHFKKVNKMEASDRIKRYRQIVSEINTVHPDLQESQLVQVDTKLGVKNARLDVIMKKDLEALVQPMLKLSGDQQGGLLHHFKEAFIRRYGDSEIPLVHALDSETGPGYLPGDQSANSLSLISDLSIPAKDESDSTISWSAADRMIDAKLKQALLAGEQSIVIIDRDLDPLPMPKNNPPLSFSCLARMTGIHSTDSCKPLIHLINLGGSSAMNLAGRFGNMDDRLHETLMDIAVSEQEVIDNSIIAEIVHLPQHRTGNVIARPVIRKHEIPYLASPSVEGEGVINIADLLLSVKNGKIILRSKRLNKTILPRMSNAHNYTLGSLPIYRFLCDLQSHDVNTHLGYDWGPAHLDSPFLPRLMYNDFILQAARWKLEKHEVEKIQAADTDEELAAAVQRLRNERKIPREIIIAESDNELWINLESNALRKLLRHQVKGAEELTIYESLLNPDEGIINGMNGPHANEFVFFYYPKN